MYSLVLVFFLQLSLVKLLVVETSFGSRCLLIHLLSSSSSGIASSLVVRALSGSGTTGIKSDILVLLGSVSIFDRSMEAGLLRPVGFCV